MFLRGLGGGPDETGPVGPCGTRDSSLPTRVIGVRL
jgi:hypothetical protein